MSQSRVPMGSLTFKIRSGEVNKGHIVQGSTVIVSSTCKVDVDSGEFDHKKDTSSTA